MYFFVYIYALIGLCFNVSASQRELSTFELNTFNLDRHNECNASRWATLYQKINRNERSIAYEYRRSQTCTYIYIAAQRLNGELAMALVAPPVASSATRVVR